MSDPYDRVREFERFMAEERARMRAGLDDFRRMAEVDRVAWTTYPEAIELAAGGRWSQIEEARRAQQDNAERMRRALDENIATLTRNLKYRW